MAHIVIVLGERSSKSAVVKGDAGKEAKSTKPAKAKTAATAKNKKKPAVRNWNKTGAGR
jgi:hypothetical protein